MNRVNLCFTPLVAGVLVSLLAVGCGDEKLADGQPCIEGRQCVSGLCATVDSGNVCTQSCTIGDECPALDDGSARVCRENSVCGAPCAYSGLRGGYLCNPATGQVLTCADGNDLDHCGACGCAVFGGGVCIEGLGCVDPVSDGGECAVDAICASLLCNPNGGTCTQPLPAGELCSNDRYCASRLCNEVCVELLVDGEPCDADRYCESGMCDAMLGCISPGAVGDACVRDTHCESGNCSTDGDYSMPGTCNIPLLSECGSAPTCTRCVSTTFLASICSRETCSSSASCGEGWSCERSTDGQRRCYQTCDPDGFFQCRDSSGTYCRSDGFCY